MSKWLKELCISVRLILPFAGAVQPKKLPFDGNELLNANAAHHKLNTRGGQNISS